MPFSRFHERGEPSKMQQLQELASIFQGILVFNNARSIGSKCLLSKVEESLAYVHEIVSKFEECLQIAKQHTRRYRAVIDWTAESRDPEDVELVRLRDKVYYHAYQTRLADNLHQDVHRWQ
jgi:hypothetical protein